MDGLPARNARINDKLRSRETFPIAVERSCREAYASSAGPAWMDSLTRSSIALFGNVCNTARRIMTDDLRRPPDGTASEVSTHQVVGTHVGVGDDDRWRVTTSDQRCHGAASAPA